MKLSANPFGEVFRLAGRVCTAMAARITKGVCRPFGARRYFCRPRWLNDYSPVPAPFHDEGRCLLHFDLVELKL